MSKQSEYIRPETIKGKSVLEVLEFFRWHEFKGAMGHPLILNNDFLSLLEEINLLRYENDLLTARVQTILLS